MLIRKNVQKNRRIILITSTVLLTFVLLSALLFVHTFLADKPDTDVFIGIHIGYGDENDAIKIIDAVEGYVNLIILGSLQLTMDTPKLISICDYLYQRNLSFIIFIAFPSEGYTPPRGPDPDFFNIAVTRWDDKFLGVYLFDEPGGKTIDQAHGVIEDAENNTDAAMRYVNVLGVSLANNTQYYAPAEFSLFTSDYALHWYDYLSGYDVVFSEFIGNNTRQIAIGLGRGAAKTLNRDWGIMITWKYDGPPFLKPPAQLYDEMVMAYENGAKYIIVFNSPEDYPPTEYGSLTSEHLEVINNFWNYVKIHPRHYDYAANTAYVLPKDYGYGFRGPSDKIWGIWEADDLSIKVWEDVNNLLLEYDSNLDIVYETTIADEPVELPYGTLIFWNGTIIQK